MNYHSQYNDLLSQLPLSMKKNIWERLTTRKRNPLSEEEASTVHSEVEKYLSHEVERYAKKKNRQRVIIAANTLPDGITTLNALDKFECQLNDREKKLSLVEDGLKSQEKTLISDRLRTDSLLKECEETISSRVKEESANYIEEIRQQFSSKQDQFRIKISELTKLLNEESHDKMHKYKQRMEKLLQDKDNENEILLQKMKQYECIMNDLKSQNITLTNRIAVLEKQDKFSIDMRNKLHKENHTLHSILFNDQTH